MEERWRALLIAAPHFRSPPCHSSCRQKKKKGNMEAELKIIKLIHKTHMLDLQLLLCLLSAFLRHRTFDSSPFLLCVVMVIGWLTELTCELGPLGN